MVSIKNGLIAGAVATFAAGSMMLMNNAIHRIPDLHVARTLAGILGSPDQAGVGWLAFLFLGIVVFGTLFAVLAPKLPVKSYFIKGLIFGAVSWLLMMVVFMPLGDGGFFGLSRSTAIAPAALVLNLVYWTVLALIYRSGVAASSPGPSRIKT
jgi:hypothetical protein